MTGDGALYSPPAQAGRSSPPCCRPPSRGSSAVAHLPWNCFAQHIVDLLKVWEQNSFAIAMSQPTNSKLLVEKQGPVTPVIINRPEVRNAVDSETARAAAFAEFEAGPEADVAVLTGAGGPVCRGSGAPRPAGG